MHVTGLGALMVHVCCSNLMCFVVALIGSFQFNQVPGFRLVLKLLVCPSRFCAL